MLCAATANHSAIVNSLRVVNLLRVVFLVGPLGTPKSVAFPSESGLEGIILGKGS